MPLDVLFACRTTSETLRHLKSQVLKSARTRDVQKICHSEIFTKCTFQYDFLVTECHLGINLSIICLFVRLSITLAFTRKTSLSKAWKYALEMFCRGNFNIELVTVQLSYLRLWQHSYLHYIHWSERISVLLCHSTVWIHRNAETKLRVFTKYHYLVLSVFHYIHM